MQKVLLVSDNHGNDEILDKVYQHYKNEVDICIHCGDSQAYVQEIEDRFLCVLGNNDPYGYQKELYLTIEGHHVLVIHGTSLADYGAHKRLIAYAKRFYPDCDTIFFGHTHIPFDKVINGIRCINPGSLNYNRDGSGNSFAIVTITKDNITAQFYYPNADHLNL